ncbi:hypothetical protein J8F10_18050 [Gemmata sp. G18]|uniref:Helix-turn-helix domain-containing protein n=1 Tax=Gemmata palustris TaxID=2822762 RepID=A0ABS5BU01_9BACT|nr:hypothetical protein [Gemmata palustris]MBP3957169.1 hypothetical protein [Gemmata palustris]
MTDRGSAKNGTKPHRGRAGADDALVSALAAGRTARESAALAGVSERTVARRLHDPAFADRIRALRSAALVAAAGRLTDGSTAAADVLRGLLTSEDEHVRHKAAVKLIELGLRISEVLELDRRVADLERLLAGAASGGAL